MTTTEYQTPTDRYDDNGQPHSTGKGRTRSAPNTNPPDYARSELKTEHTRFVVAAELQARVEHYQHLVAESAGAEKMAARNSQRLLERVVEELTQ